MTGFTVAAERGNFWLKWLAAHLPAGLSQHVSGAAEREATLVVFADSPAWSARLRYALAELEGEIRAAPGAPKTVRVRVLPRSDAAPRQDG